MAYFWFRAFHLVGVVVWFAGLFYLVRLYIYHVEAKEQPEPAQSILKNQYLLMEKRLYNLITTPGMILTATMAAGLLSTEPAVLHDTWLHIKLSLVAGLIGYHFYCGRLLKQLEADQCNWTSKQLRALNEAPTLFLVAIVMLAVFKNNFPTGAATWLMAGLVVLMAVTIQLYAKKRKRDEAKRAEAALATANNPGEPVSSGS